MDNETIKTNMPIMNDTPMDYPPMCYVTQDGKYHGLITLEVDPNQYNPFNGVLKPVVGFTIQLFYWWAGSRTFCVVYGQKVHRSFKDAKKELKNGMFWTTFNTPANTVDGELKWALIVEAGSEEIPEISYILAKDIKRQI